MDKERIILHCDLNNFFASVECLKNPNLKNVPMIVGGDITKRHGVVLAKNEIAKTYGIVTGEPVVYAVKKCKNLVSASPSYEDYHRYSKIVQNIYLEYTEYVEPFGIDECFLDVTDVIHLYKDEDEIAMKIKEEVKEKTGLTISVGVSFNKVFAKLGSDMKKPDAITKISKQTFKKQIYSLPASSILGVGKSVNNILKNKKIYTLGDIASIDKKILASMIGKAGIVLHDYVNGIDNSKVSSYYDIKLPKSISKGRTFFEDTEDVEYILSTMWDFCKQITFELREYKMSASTVGINIKFFDFTHISRQQKIFKTNKETEIFKVMEKLLKKEKLSKKVRAITVNISDFEDDNFHQTSIFDENKENTNKINNIVDNLKNKYGMDKINFGTLKNGGYKDKI